MQLIIRMHSDVLIIMVNLNTIDLKKFIKNPINSPLTTIIFLNFRFPIFITQIKIFIFSHPVSLSERKR